MVHDHEESVEAGLQGECSACAAVLALLQHDRAGDCCDCEQHHRDEDPPAGGRLSTISPIGGWPVGAPGEGVEDTGAPPPRAPTWEESHGPGLPGRPEVPAASSAGNLALPSFLQSWIVWQCNGSQLRASAR
jgi:hypothetical protein